MDAHLPIKRESETGSPAETHHNVKSFWYLSKNIIQLYKVMKQII